MSDQDPEPEVGREIRHLRKAKGLTNSELSKLTGLSVGFLSQIENGRSSPSVKALHSIAAALGVNISWFFTHEENLDDNLRDVVVRSNSRRQIRFENGITDELLSPNLGRKIELLQSRLPARTSSGSEPYRHAGEEAGIVLHGQMKLWIDEQLVVLNAGDSFAFESDLPHRYENPTDDETIVVWVVTPPSY